MRNPSQLSLCLSLLVGLAACGQAGDLYLPDRQPETAAEENPGVAPVATDPSEAQEEKETPEEEKEATEALDATTAPGAAQP